MRGRGEGPSVTAPARVGALHVENSIPGETLEPWQLGQDQASDAAAAILYCLNTLVTGDMQQAVWAAHCANDAIDSFVVNICDIDISLPGALELTLKSPLVQAELARQHRDLDELANW